jgi:hypothetical protein
MIRCTLVYCALAIAFAGATGCGSPPHPARSASESAGGAPLTLPRKPLRGLGVNEEPYLQIAEMVPSFAGAFIDSTGVPTVLVDDSSRAGAALSAVKQVIGAPFTSSGAKGPRTAVVRFRYRQLADWRDSLVAHAFANKAVTGVGMDQRRNVVRVGLEDLAMQDSVVGLLARLRIPRAAVRIETERRFTHPIGRIRRG